MSHRAIAAALALDDVSAGERLAAFSLASFANRQQLAWPGTRIAAARAGLSRSQYLAARDGLVRRGVLEVDSPAGGRGNSPLVRLRFPERDHQVVGGVNAELFETVLSYSRARGSARLLLAVLAALSDDGGTVAGVRSDELCEAAGIGDSSYRRARRQLLASGEVALDAAGGGRALTNRWLVRDPRARDRTPLVAPAPRPVPAHDARPIVAAAPQRAARVGSSDELGEAPGGRRNRPGSIRVTAVGRSHSPAEPRMNDLENRPDLNGVSGINPGQSRRVSGGNGPDLNGVSGINPGQSRTVSAKTPAETPPETPPPNACAGREPQNLRTTPPNPPEGGQRAPATIVEHYVSERGRRRHRTITIDLDAVARQLRPPSVTDSASWEHIRETLQHRVGESTFEIWLAGLELVAVDAEDLLVIACDPSRRGWIATRFSALLDATGTAVGRGTRLTTDAEQQLLSSLDAGALFGAPTPPKTPVPADQREAI